MESTPTPAARCPASSVHRPQTAGTKVQFAGSVLSVLAMLSLGAPIAAQYTPPGRPVDQGGIPQEKSLQDSLEKARWNLGKLRLSPWVGLRNVAFVSNVSNQPDEEGEDDFTVTVGAGLRAYLRSGPKVIWAAQALPEYTWWQDAEAKRRLNGRYGLGVFGYFNRLKFEASARRLEVQNLFTPELQQLTSNRQDQLRLALDFEFLRRFHLVLSNEIQRIENQEEDTPIFRLLDRDLDLRRAIVRYQARRFTLGLGYEDGSTDFSSQARRLSNTETAELLEWTFDSPRLDTFFSLARRTREADGGSDFQALEETTGYLDLLWKIGDRSSLLTYARRDLFYSIIAGNSSVLSSRYGARFEIGGRRARVAWFAELGDDDFDAVAPGAVSRIDDVTSAGFELTVKYRRLFQTGIRLSKTEYDSNIDAFDRDFFTASATVELGGLLERLRLGHEGDDW